MQKVELLSPAKNIQTAILAINSGADAIYIGASDFGARINAANTLESIEKLVNYAHKFYVRVHVTINTILNNEELKKAQNLVEKLYSIGVDAIIVQDMGLIKLAIEGKISPIQIHASTQCDNRTLEKIKFFDNIGISRVILARELSLNQIKNICKNANCEIETFIHGALCVSYSGKCYLSYANGGRSANRGECAQPCRKKYSLVDENGKVYFKEKHLLSLKDFNGSESIKELISYGVKSFKIEGRLKDENYVKNVTLYYNNLINKYAKRTSSGKVFTDLEPNINKTFNRQYTDYFLNKRGECYNFSSPKSTGEYIGKVTKICKNFFELDTKCKLNAQDGICYKSEKGFDGFKINKIDGNKIYPNKITKLKLGEPLSRNYDFEYDMMLSKSKITRKIGVCFTIYENKVIANDEDNNTAIIEFVSNEKAKNKDKIKETYIKQFQKTGQSDFYTINTKIATDNIPFLSVSKINEIRRNILDILMDERLKNYPKYKQNLLNYAKYYQDNIDYRENILNSEAEIFYKKSGCKIIEKAPESSTYVKSGIELMRCKHCLRYAAGICTKSSNVKANLYLVDEQDKKYQLKFDCKNCEMIILNP